MINPLIFIYTQYTYSSPSALAPQPHHEQQAASNWLRYQNNPAGIFPPVTPIRSGITTYYPKPAFSSPLPPSSPPAESSSPVGQGSAVPDTSIGGDKEGTDDDIQGTKYQRPSAKNAIYGRVVGAGQGMSGTYGAYCVQRFAATLPIFCAAPIRTQPLRPPQTDARQISQRFNRQMGDLISRVCLINLQ